MQNKGRGRLHGTVQRVYVEPQQQQVPWELAEKTDKFSFSINSSEKQVKQTKKTKNKERSVNLADQHPLRVKMIYEYRNPSHLFDLGKMSESGK